jgi:UDP-GlcNAc:undecaprenyl-phosphate GlcNAc-1-phosphate transferase
MMALTSAFFAFVATILLMFVLRPVAKEIGLVDIPGGRKRHGVRVPLIGGLATSIAIGLALSLTEQPAQLFPTILAVYLLVLVGTVDDKFDLPAGVRLIAQAAAAMLVVYGGGIVVQSLDQSFFINVPLGPLSALFSLLFIVTIINAFNVIDGIDGLAGSLSLIALVSLAIVGVGCDLFGLAIVAAGAVSAFLVFNLPLGINRQLRSFMGDAGSTSLGLIIATVGIAVSQSPVCDVAPVVGLWLVAVPVYDLFSAAIRRVMEGKSPFAPDHEHLHHALMEAGLSGRLSLLFMVVWASGFASIGLAGHFLEVEQGLLLIGWFLGLLAYYQAMRRPQLVVGLMHSVLRAITEIAREGQR